MPLRHPVELKATAVYMAAGQSARSVGRDLGIPGRTVSRWIIDADPAELASYVAEKRARAAALIASRLDEGIEKVQDAIRDAETLEQARTAQALATAHGILGTKLHELSGAGQGGAGGRFGDGSGSSDPRLRDIGQRILERLEQRPDTTPE